ncbi:hypothetical protein [Methylomonas koyamae]|uniref:hypothetical protein n=1 Tax=Methylomonas koyamae TaxID=702114 RepID=UPI0012F66897|nr:hypothetical protein [Methylomonas koyamae]
MMVQICRADDGQFPEFTWHGLLDLRYQHSDAAPGELEHGLGKLRAGGDRDRWRVNEAAATLQVRLDWDWMVNATVKYADRQSAPLDLTEAYLAYRPVGAAGWRLAGRLGMFFPPISLENTGTAWSSPYTLSSSTINAWVGEELRAFGGELRLDYQTEAGDKFGVFGAGLANNDTAGLTLAWRGWSLHDFESTLTGRLRLPNGIAIPALFPKQANASQAFVEVDGRPGFTPASPPSGRNATRCARCITTTMPIRPRCPPANTAGTPGSGAWAPSRIAVGNHADFASDDRPYQHGRIARRLAGGRCRILVGKLAVEPAAGRRPF